MRIGFDDVLTTEQTTRPPVLVTGVPRSGTTWLARLLAAGTGMAMTGREPMNPRGRQYGLHHTLAGWTRLTHLSPRQGIALRFAYRGLNPWTYSRYGYRQWAAPLPRTRNVIKDPFAMLSIPSISAATGASTVVVYRHPAAVMASYRRMGWSPDLDEVQQLIIAARETGGPILQNLPARDEVNFAQAIGHFWVALHEFVLHDLRHSEVACRAHVVAHADAATGGIAAGQAIAKLLDIRWNKAMDRSSISGPSASVSPTSLHNLDRDPAQVAEAWRHLATAEEIADLESVTAQTHSSLEKLRVRLSVPA